MLVLLDTNVYLRVAKRIRPALGIQFGQKGYVVTVHKIIEDEVRRSARLQRIYPWFDGPEYSDERLAKQIRLSADEKRLIEIAQSVLQDAVLSDPVTFTQKGRSPPGDADCWLLALCQVKSGILVSDDLGIHLLAEMFDLPIWHGHELLGKLKAAKIIDSPKIREIYEALDTNSDLPASWREAKRTTFKKILGGG